MESYGFLTNSWPVRKPFRKVRRRLAGIMFVESLLVFGLAWRDYALAATPTMSFAALLAISGVGFWAAYATWVKDPSWLWASLLGQFSILVLAVYTLMVDFASPFPQFAVGVIACILGCIAIVCILYILRYRPRSAFPAWVIAIVTASVALIGSGLGFVQFWLQNDYLPRISAPLVDVITDLAPTGKTGETVQLEAKVTITNHSLVPVYVGGSVMRITAHPRAHGKPTPSSEAAQFGLIEPDTHHPLPTDQGTLLYANNLLSIGDVMHAGQSITYRNVVDFDSHEWRLARLDVDGIFITSPNIDGVYTCPGLPYGVWFHDPRDPDGTHVGPQVSENSPRFNREIGKPIYQNVPGGGVKEFSCREIRIKPRNVIHDITGDHSTFQILAILKDPENPSIQPPAVLLWWGANGNYSLNSAQWKKVSAANPATSFRNIGAEYSPSEQSALPGGGTPSTTQPTSTSQPPSNTQPR